MITRPWLCVLLAAACISGLSALELISDAEYEAQLKQSRIQLAEATTDEDRHFARLMLSSALFAIREYAEYEEVMAQFVKEYPELSWSWANWSVAAGKQGKYDEALARAKVAVSLAHKNGRKQGSLHAQMISASWMHQLGHVEEAKRIVDSWNVPEDEELREFYFGCLACYAADAGRIDDLKRALAEASDSDANRAFFERDIVFDPYRNEDWFIEIVGQTLAPSADEGE